MCKWVVVVVVIVVVVFCIGKAQGRPPLPTRQQTQNGLLIVGYCVCCFVFAGWWWSLCPVKGLCEWGSLWFLQAPSIWRGAHRSHLQGLCVLTAWCLSHKAEPGPAAKLTALAACLGEDSFNTGDLCAGGLIFLRPSHGNGQVVMKMKKLYLYIGSGFVRVQ